MAVLHVVNGQAALTVINGQAALTVVNGQAALTVVDGVVGTHGLTSRPPWGGNQGGRQNEAEVVC